MKKIILLSCLVGASLFAGDPVNPVTNDTPNRGSGNLMVQNELGSLNALIGATKQNLDNQQKLRSEIETYQNLEAEYLKNTENTELLFRVAKSANSVYTTIEESHLNHVFSPEFMKEIKLFSQVARKRGIPKAR